MMSREYLSFTKRERTGIITLVILLIITTLVPKFFCNPKPVSEKLSDKQIEQLAEKKTNNYPERKRLKGDTVYVYLNKPAASPLYLRGNRAGQPRGTGGTRQRNNYTARQDWVQKPLRPKWIRKPPQPIDINTADTSAFIALPGIGSKLANRIVSFRTKLGGFNSVEQIKQVYGLQDSVYQRILPFLTLKLSG